MNTNTDQFLLLILIGVIANANDLDLANNTTILLLLALILFGNNFSSGCCWNNQNNCFCRGTRTLL